MSGQIKPPSEYNNRYLSPRQVTFIANDGLAKVRSRVSVPEREIWKKKPPDFSVRLYRSLTLPRKSSQLGEKYQGAASGPNKQWTELEVIPDPRCCKALPRREPGKFHTTFKHIGPFEANLVYVKDGVYPKDRYQDPRPHDFRQYEAGIPDFTARYSRDPFDLKFKSQRLSSLYERAAAEQTPRRDTGRHFHSHQPAEPKWDPTLILPKSPWPPKSASYTRHRRRREVYSAFMDRVEEKFTASNQEILPKSSWKL